MTRKDFELIAETISYERAKASILTKDTIKGRAERAAWEKALNQISYAFAGNLAETNPNFDKDRFLKAAGVA